VAGDELLPNGLLRKESTSNLLLSAPPGNHFVLSLAAGNQTAWVAFSWRNIYLETGARISPHMVGTCTWLVTRPVVENQARKVQLDRDDFDSQFL